MTLTIGDMDFKGITEIDESGGSNTTETRTEKGLEFTSRIDPEPVEIDVTAYVPNEQYSNLQRLRDTGEPVEASLGSTALSEAAVESVSIRSSGEQTSHVEADITIREIQTFSPGSATITTEAGSTAAEDTNEDESETEDPSGTLGTNAPGSDEDNNAVSQAIGNFADGIGNAVGGLFG